MKANKFTKETIAQIGIEQKEIPEFKQGDTVAVSLLIKEGGKERIQIFQGDVIAIHRNGASSTFTVRRLSVNNIYVEKILPFYSPKIKKIEVVKLGDVRRAKLYYLRDRIGKAARVKEKVMTKEQLAAKKEKAKSKAKDEKPKVEKEDKVVAQAAKSNDKE